MRVSRLVIGLSSAIAVAVATVLTTTAEAESSAVSRVSTAGTVFAAVRDVPVAGSALPGAGLLTSQINWTGTTASLTYGAAAILRGQVVIADGALPGAAVALYARPAGSSSWTYLGTRTSSTSTGIFRFETHRPARNTDYRAVYRGEFLFAASSASTRVNVRRVLTSTMSDNSDDTFTMSGSVAPKYAGKLIRLQRKTCASCSWSTITSSVTSSTSGWRFRVSGPSSVGTWSYRTYVPGDSTFLTSYSDTWLIRAYYS